MVHFSKSGSDQDSSRKRITNPLSMHKRTLIFVSGTVGAGKTSLSAALFNLMLRKGRRVCYRSFTAFPLFSYMFFKIVAILLYGLDTVRYHERVRIHPSTLFVLRIRRLPKLIVALLMLLESLSIILTFYIKVILTCTGKDVIIVDEGFLNIIANYMEIFRSKGAFFASLIVNFMRRLQKKFKLITIYLDANDNILLKRWVTRGYPVTTSLIGMKYHLRYVYLIRCSKTLVSSTTPLIELDTSDKKLLLKEFIKELSIHND